MDVHSILQMTQLCLFLKEQNYYIFLEISLEYLKYKANVIINSLMVGML